VEGYAGRVKKLSPRVLAEGVHKCIENATLYISSAEILHKSSHNQHAYLMCLFAMEEMGKVPIIFNAPKYARSERGWRLWRKKFTDHGEKFWHNKDLEDIEAGIMPMHKNKSERKKEILKQDVAYVDFRGGLFDLPRKVSNDDVREVLETAKRRLEQLRGRHPSIEVDQERFESTDWINDLSVDELKALARKQGFQIASE
jgi:AbiV family abortive infection protein